MFLHFSFVFDFFQHINISNIVSLFILKLKSNIFCNKFIKLSYIKGFYQQL